MNNSQAEEASGRQKRSAGAGRRTTIALIAAVALVLVLAGVAVAALMPTVGASAQAPLDHMLPASTVAYVAADLNPAGATQSELNRIRTSFTDQPGWAGTAVARETKIGLSQQTGGSKCAAKVQRGLTSELHDLGHDTTFAITSLAGIHFQQTGPFANSTGSNAANIQALEQDFVVLAALHVQMSLFQALTSSGLSFATHTTAGSYQGTSIYAEHVTGCGTSPSSDGNFFAAELKNWVVLSATPQALHSVIDAANGRQPNLSSVDSYTSLISHLPVNQLGSYYVNGSALKNTGLLRAFKAQRGIGSTSPNIVSQLQSAFRPAAGALSVDANGINFMSLSQQQSSGSSTSQAGTLASSLPSTTSFYLSILGLKTALPKLLNEGLAATSAPLGSRFNGVLPLPANPLGGDRSKLLTDLDYVTANMTGEVDIVSFKPTAPTMPRAGMFGGPSNPATPSVAAMWRINSDAAASANLSNLARATGVSKHLIASVAADGSTYYATAQGAGYAVRKGWAIVSSNIPVTLADLAKKPAQTLSAQAAYQRAVPAGGAGSSVWYANLAELRQWMELLTFHAPGSAGPQSSYLPLLKPLQALSGSSGSLGGYQYAFLRLDIS